MNKLLYYLLSLLLCWCFTLTNSRTSSTLWRLDGQRITTGGNERYSIGTLHVAADALNNAVTDNHKAIFDLDIAKATHDEIFYIIATTLNEERVGWVRKKPILSLPHENITTTTTTTPTTTTTAFLQTPLTLAQHATAPYNIDSIESEDMSTTLSLPPLDCGKPVNFTYYDYLVGVGKRREHPAVPDPDVAYLFLKSRSETALRNFDLSVLERRLRRAKRERPQSVQLYNQIGNYWRIVGDASQAIECFRRALAMAPTNADVLLNLARVLFQLQYLDDAIHLTRRSLELQPPGRAAWQQYFTLGQIFKTYGHFHEAAIHLRRAHELHPHYEPILKALRELHGGSDRAELHVYTLVIIVALVFLVLLFVIKSTPSCDNNKFDSSCLTFALSTHSGNCAQQDWRESGCNARYNVMQRSFNRAMSMRTLRGFTARHMRQRRN